MESKVVQFLCKYIIQLMLVSAMLSMMGLALGL